MSRIIERRKIKLPPLKINKDLIDTIGTFLESRDMNTKYSLKSDIRSIDSGRIVDFVESEWPTTINNIVVESSVPEDREFSRVRIVIRTNSALFSEGSITISGIDGIWVNGISESLNNIIEINKLPHYWFIQSEIIKIFTTLLLSLSFLYGLAYFVGYSLIFEMGLGPLITLLLSLSMPMYGLIMILFPYFEYGETFSLKIRKYIVAGITISGIISWVIENILKSFIKS